MPVVFSFQKKLVISLIISGWSIVSMGLRILLLIFFSLSFSIPSLYGQEIYREVEAAAGDGIYTLLRRHGLEPAAHIQSFIELNQEQLGAGQSLQLGKTYRIPVLKSDFLVSQPDSLQEADSSHVLSPEEESIAEPLTPSAAKEEAAIEEPSTPEPLPVKAKEKDKAASANLSKSEKAQPMLLDEPLFGKNYASVELKDQQLQGAVYYLISGHGGPDPGAIGQYGPYALSEDEYAYDVTLRLARRLMEHGAKVYMIIQDANDGIRDENILLNDRDEICYPDEVVPFSQNDRLRQRTYAVNNLYLKHKGAYQRMMAIHVDSRNVGQNIDVFFYHHQNSPSGKKLAEHIHQTIASKYGLHQPNRPYAGNVSTRSGLFVLKYSHPPAVFVELGNIRNERDQRRFVLPENRQALANWMCEGILVDYLAEKK